MKKMLSMILSVSMLASFSIPVFAEEITVDVTEIEQSTENNKPYDHDKAMEEFRVQLQQRLQETHNATERFTELILDIENNFEPYGQYDENGNFIVSYYKFKDEEGSCFEASNNRYYICNLESRSRENFKDYFDTKTIDGINYITLDGYDYEYYIEDNRLLLAGFIPKIGYLSCPILYSSPYEEEYENYYYLADKYYEYYSTDIMKFRNLWRLNNIMNEYGCSMEIAITVIAQQDAQGTIYQRNVDANRADDPNAVIEVPKGDLNADGQIDIKDLGILKKFITKSADLSTMQKVNVTNNENMEPDIRDVTRMNQYIVKLVSEF